MYVRTELNVVNAYIHGHPEASAGESKWSPPFSIRPKFGKFRSFGDAARRRHLPPQLILGSRSRYRLRSPISHTVAYLIAVQALRADYIHVHIRLVRARGAMNYIYLARKRRNQSVESIPFRYPRAIQLNVPLRKHSEISISRIRIQKIGLESL